jgi:hypothetical protein
LAAHSALVGGGVEQAGYSTLFDTVTNWSDRLARAHHAGQLETELKKIRRYKLIIIDEVGYISSTPTLRTSSSNSSNPATNKHPSWSPPTCPEVGGANPSPTTSSPPR